VQVLVDCSLALGEGEALSVLGASGSGKSTLLHILGTLERPDAGRLRYRGRDLLAAGAGALSAFRREELGFIFQFHHLLPAFTAIENVMLPAWGDEGYPSAAMRSQAEELLRAVGLADRLGHRTNDLSGGQQQRVAIARALSRRPLIVLADEPTGNLDTESANEVFELMRRFNRDSGTTFLVVTHDSRIADRCDRVIQIVDGLIRTDELRPTP
jgi:lipoprotein-releasing system ATP-binding protein